MMQVRVLVLGLPVCVQLFGSVAHLPRRDVRAGVSWPVRPDRGQPMDPRCRIPFRVRLPRILRLAAGSHSGRARAGAGELRCPWFPELPRAGRRRGRPPDGRRTDHDRTDGRGRSRGLPTIGSSSLGTSLRAAAHERPVRVAAYGPETIEPAHAAASGPRSLREVGAPPRNRT